MNAKQIKLKTVKSRTNTFRTILTKKGIPKMFKVEVWKRDVRTTLMYGNSRRVETGKNDLKLKSTLYIYNRLKDWNAKFT